MIIHAFDVDLESGVPTEEQLGNLILAMKHAQEQADKAAELKAKADAQQGGKPDYTNPSNGDNSHREDKTAAGRSGAKA
jgi:hypothetical protein